MDEKGGNMKGRGKQGFASLSLEKRTEIARRGGLAAQKAGTAHQWNSIEASAAGKKSVRKRKIK
jgi:general stress protein YciG